MRVVIAGGHGKIALHLTAELVRAGDHPVGLIRDPDHAADITSLGGTPAVVDLESVGSDVLADHVAGADAVVFAAGAGPGSGAPRKLTVDRDGAIKLIEAAQGAGVNRYVMVSAINADDFDPGSKDVMQVYLRAKSEADQALRASGLDWTIARPGRLSDDDPTGEVRIAERTGRGQIPRTDVATVLHECLRRPETAGAQFELISGDVPIATAVTEFVERTRGG